MSSKFYLTRFVQLAAMFCCTKWHWVWHQYYYWQLVPPDGTHICDVFLGEQSATVERWGGEEGERESCCGAAEILARLPGKKSKKYIQWNLLRMQKKHFLRPQSILLTQTSLLRKIIAGWFHSPLSRGDSSFFFLSAYSYSLLKLKLSLGNSLFRNSAPLSRNRYSWPSLYWRSLGV